MTSYPENALISIEVPVLDANGEPYVGACLATYYLQDTEGTQLLEGAIENAEEKISIEIAPEYNTVPKGQIKDARSLTVTFNTTDGHFISTTNIPYIVNAKEPLIVGVNSFVTLDKCRLIAMTVPNLDQFAKATDDEILLALSDSFTKIQGLRFALPYDSQSSICYGSRYAFTLLDITEESYSALPDDFKSALEKAQVIEANSTLAPTDDIVERRQKGVILETIHEVKMMFSSVAPIKSNMSSDAMRVLSRWLVRSIRIARA